MKKYIVTAKILNVRNTPRISDNKIGELKKNDLVEFIEKSPDNNWSKVKRNGLEGWVSNAFIFSVKEDEEFSWIAVALNEFGTKEVEGDGDNPRVIKYLNTTRLDTTPGERSNDETPWCSAFVNWCVEQAGYKGTDKSAADSWLKWGKEISIPRRGCITVLKREKGNHVGFYVRESDDGIEILGGNQNDAVNISTKSKSDLLSYRILIESPIVSTATKSDSLSNDTIEKIKQIAANSPIAKYVWKDRGEAPIGYTKGVALTYAKSYRELKAKQNTAVTVMSQPIGNKNTDALAWYEVKTNSDVERLRAIYTLALGLGMRESSGNTTVGWDKSKLKEKPPIEPTSENSEGGLFQVSWDSINRSPWLLKLYEQYQANPNQCLLSTFMEKTKDKKEIPFGSGDGLKFQKLMKECPALATEYVIIMLRVNRRHFGPINTKKAEYISDAEQMFKDIEKVIDTAP